MNDILITKEELAKAFDEGYQYALFVLNQSNKGDKKNATTTDDKFNPQNSNQSGCKTDVATIDL
jgi:hypothetical protein